MIYRFLYDIANSIAKVGKNDYDRNYQKIEPDIFFSYQTANKNPVSMMLTGFFFILFYYLAERKGIEHFLTA